MRKKICFEEHVEKQPETEMVVYAKIGDMSGFVHAKDLMHHIQYEGIVSNGNRCRVRITEIADQEDKIEFTVKVKKDDNSVVQSNHEHTVPVTKEFAECFKHAADSLIDKMRYVFVSEHVSLNVEGDENIKSIELPEIYYEVDVYKKPDGTISDWCKIDIELDHVIQFLEQNHPDVQDIKVNLKVSHLPFKPTNPIVSTTEDEAGQAKIKELWDTEFKIKQ